MFHWHKFLEDNFYVCLSQLLSTSQAFIWFSVQSMLNAENTALDIFSYPDAKNKPFTQNLKAHIEITIIKENKVASYY